MNLKDNNNETTSKTTTMMNDDAFVNVDGENKTLSEKNKEGEEEEINSNKDKF